MNLKQLRLCNNQLSGPFFSFFGVGRTRMTNLFFVEFYAGVIPESLGNLGNLKQLFLSRNQLSGPFFSFFGVGRTRLTNLFFVQFCAGSIPASLGNLGKLTQLSLHENQLTGHPLPLFEVGRTRVTTTFHRFLVPFHQGAIPESLDNLKNLEELDLSYNELEGQFPPLFGLVSAV